MAYINPKAMTRITDFFLSRKFDLINLFLRLGYSSLLNVSCAQILPRLGHSSLLNVSCAQIWPKTGSQFVAQCLLCTNIAQIEQNGTNEQHGSN